MKQIVVVGGGGALGRALVGRLLDRNYQVTVVGRSKPPDAGIQHFYPMDATVAPWPSLYEDVEKDCGAAIDAVMFVAGRAVFGKTPLIPLARARETFELNFWACAAAAQAAAQYWEKRKQPGKFVAVLSIVARRAVPFEAYYSASKAATARFLECLQLEYADQRIEFVCAFPGMLKTPFRRQAEWYGLQPALLDEGADVGATARAITALLEGRRKNRVIGWRERSIDLADRCLPGLYDRAVLRSRVRRILK
jgi:NAD(P)-dependent dehydrogenase (short-subunit alcohol dehydrogenase family)